MMRMFVLSVVVCFACGIGSSKTWEEMTWEEKRAELETMTDEEILTCYGKESDECCRNLETNMTWEAAFKFDYVGSPFISVLNGNLKRRRTDKENRLIDLELTRIKLKMLVCLHRCMDKLSKIKIRPENEPWLYKGKPFAPDESFMTDPKEIKAWRNLRKEVAFSRKIRSVIGTMERVSKSFHSTIQLKLTVVKEEEPEDYPVYKKLVDELVPDESLKQSLWRPYPHFIFIPAKE